MSTMWKVVPLSEGQLLDVRPEDVLNDGLYRRCDTYRGGGGYDQFPKHASQHFGGSPEDYRNQFVVQLYGCNLDCPYCYVTRAGVWGKFEKVSSKDLVKAFIQSGCKVFHLMGGAPALHLPQWREIIDKLPKQAVFHSDLLLTEHNYSLDVLKGIARSNCLYAIDVKGTTDEEWRRNTRKEPVWGRFWNNWYKIQEANVPAYVTFTACDSSWEARMKFWSLSQDYGIDKDAWIPTSYDIELVKYDALPHVDDVPWGIGTK